LRMSCIGRWRRRLDERETKKRGCLLFSFLTNPELSRFVCPGLFARTQAQRGLTQFRGYGTNDVAFPAVTPGLSPAAAGSCEWPAATREARRLSASTPWRSAHRDAPVALLRFRTYQKSRTTPGLPGRHTR